MKDEDINPAVVVVILIVIAVALVGSYIILSGGTSGASSWKPYQFKEGAHYKYSATADMGSGTFSWDVISVSGDQITVDVSWTLDGENDSIRVSGDKDKIYQKVTEKSQIMGPFLISSLYGSWIQPLFTKAGEAGLSVGNTWSVEVPDGTWTAEITRTETYAGLESYVMEARINDNLEYRVAIAKDLGFPTYVFDYDPNVGEKTLEVKLLEYSS